VTVTGDLVRINGEVIAHVKHVLESGDVLAPIASGEIPPGHYYLAGEHPDSYDSRYASFGLIAERAIKATATRVW
jgi:conjugal transfer pilin signal peptidase TrbI